ncbi:MAG: hypothetical protein U1F98_14965 [Verrucomicrobiota bacterium]
MSTESGEPHNPVFEDEDEDEDEDKDEDDGARSPIHQSINPVIH